jgi:flap endonuclease-1
MGVKLLNKFIRLNCNNNDSIKKKSLITLKNKKIAIDTSIYMYRYEGERMLYEGFYNLCSILKKYNIIPLFVFDGKPPKEKQEELQIRYEEKEKAKKKYEKLKKELDSLGEEKDEIEEKMDKLRKKFIKIKKNQIKLVKEIITLFGFNYIDADGEADNVCALLCLKKKVYAVMSEDMDMFVYGCPIVIRYFSLTNHNCVIYDYNKIINELKLDDNEFKDLCILSGTDYLKKSKNTIFYYYKTIKSEKKIENILNYFSKNKEEEILLENTKKMYNLIDNINLITEMESIEIKNDNINHEKLSDLMKIDNFIFV